MRSNIYLRRAVIIGSAALLAIGGVAVGAAPSFADPTLRPDTQAGCPTTTASPTLAQQPVATPNSLLGGSWVQDRAQPTGGYGPVTCDGVSSYVIAADASAVKSGNPSTNYYYRWEGVKQALPAGSNAQSVSTNIYINTAETSQIAGLWTWLNDGSGNATNDGFGIITYCGASLAGQTGCPVANGSTATTKMIPSGWNVFNSDSGAWTNIAGPQASSGWATIEVAIDPTNPNVVDYYLNGAVTKISLAEKYSYVDTVGLEQYNNGTNSFDTYFSGTSYGTSAKPLTVTRLGGADRYATAVDVSQSQFPKGFNGAAGSTVVLATGENYADALSGAPLAALKDAPLLLTQTNSVPSVAQTELKRLDPANVIILGGYGAVAQSVYIQIQGLLPKVDLVQVGGVDRYATSLTIAQKYFSSDSSGSAFVATGTAFPDALSAAPAAGSTPFPVLLVNGSGSTIPSQLASWLKSDVTQKLYVAGGTGAVSAAVVNQLQSSISGSVVPFAGSDRYATNVLINGSGGSTPSGTFWNKGAAGAGSLYGAPTTVYLATGLNYPDALTGAAAAGIDKAPLFLTNGTCVPANVLSTIASWSSVQTIYVLGGTGAQTADVQALKSC